MYLAAFYDLYDIPLIVSYVVLTKNIQEEHSRYTHLLVITLVCMSAINGCTPINNRNACICNHYLGNYQRNKVCYIKPKITS